MLKNAVKRVLPERVVVFVSGSIYISTHIHHFLPNCFTLTPLKNLFGVLWGIERVPQGSERFFENFFHAIKRTLRNPHFVDVGANSGWFPRIISRYLSGDYPISCYEPLKSMRPHLEKLSKRNPSVRYKSVAVGERQGNIEIIELGSNGLSSIREVNPSYLGYAKSYDTAAVNKYEVEVVTLDGELDELIKADEEVVLKIDTQGYELQVIMGCRSWLESGRIKFIIVELMTIRKYSGAALYNEIFSYLHELNYSLYDINPGVYEDSGMLSEFDAVFVHNPIVAG